MLFCTREVCTAKSAHIYHTYLLLNFEAGHNTGPQNPAAEAETPQRASEGGTWGLHTGMAPTRCCSVQTVVDEMRAMNANAQSDLQNNSCCALSLKVCNSTLLNFLTSLTWGLVGVTCQLSLVSLAIIGKGHPGHKENWFSVGPDRFFIFFSFPSSVALLRAARALLCSIPHTYHTSLQTDTTSYVREYGGKWMRGSRWPRGVVGAVFGVAPGGGCRSACDGKSSQSSCVSDTASRHETTQTPL